MEEKANKSGGLARAIDSHSSPSNVVIEDSVSVLHGTGTVIASANAYKVTLQDCGPQLRRILFGSISHVKDRDRI